MMISDTYKHFRTTKEQDLMLYGKGCGTWRFEDMTVFLSSLLFMSLVLPHHTLQTLVVDKVDSL